MHRARSRRRRDGVSTIARAESRRDGCGNRIERRQRLRRGSRQQSAVVHDTSGAPREEPVSRDAEHGGHRRLLGRDAAVVDRAGQGRERFAPAEHGAACRAFRDRAAGRAARVLDHARQSEPVGAGDGQSGVLPGDGLRPDRRDGGRGGSARAERDDACHRLERAALIADSPRSDDRLEDEDRRGDYR